MSPDRVEPSQRPFRVGDWVVTPELNRINGDGRVVRVEPRVMKVLLYLAASAGRVVPRRELHEAVWGETVVCEQTLTRAIWELRNALGDDPAHPRIIETIRKGGYRLIAPVTNGESSAAPHPADLSVPEAARRAWLRPALWALAGILVAIVGTTLWIGHFSSERSGRPAILAGLPLTSAPGKERYPAISPDGTMVAFSSKGDDGESYAVHVKQVGRESSLRLTDSVENEFHPAWSPDGSTIAFVRGARRHEIHTVRLIGGEERDLGDVGWGVQGIDWSPDGRWIAYCSYDGPLSPTGIMLISVETLERRALTDPPERTVRYSWPRFSPDGETVAVVRSSNPVQEDIYLVPATGGDPRRLTHLLCPVAGMAWTADGEHLVASASRGQDYLLWRVSARDGALLALPTQITPASYPSLARRSDRLVYETKAIDRDIWRLSLEPAGGEKANAVPFVQSTRIDGSAEFSPDGSRVLFVSSRSGHREVWVCDRDGNDPRRVTSLEGLAMAQPRWSPDGRRIAFSTFLGDYGRAFVVSAEGGVARALSTAARHEIVEGWSRDGEWLTVNCSTDDGWQMERVRLDGTESVPLEIANGSLLFETGDGDLLYLESGKQGIWRVSADGGEPENVVDPSVTDGWTDITVVEEGVYFVRRTPEGETLGFHGFETGEADTLASLDGFGNAFLAVAPDRKAVLFDRSEREESDVILLRSL